MVGPLQERGPISQGTRSWGHMGSYVTALLLDRIDRKIDGLINRLARVESTQGELMATTNTTAAALGDKLTAIETSLASIRADVTGLKAKITEMLAAGGISQADADALLAQATRIATSAAVLDAETPNTPAA
jgi:hypothetical protein